MFDEMEGKLPNLIVHDGLSNSNQINEWTEGVDHPVIVLNDLASQIVTVVLCHKLPSSSHQHSLTQNLFMARKCSRSKSLNSRYVNLSRNKRDSRKILNFGR